MRPPRDIDVLFALPIEVNLRFAFRVGNKQSALLAEVKDRLAITFPSTDMQADGQIVLVPFSSYKVEVVPAFLRGDGGYDICNTHDGGSYKTIFPRFEISEFDRQDGECNGNIRKLTRILKQWQRKCNVPIKSFHLEHIVTKFIATYPHRMQDEYYFDWMLRDTFGFMLTQSNGSFFVPGTGELIFLGNAWLSKAESAYRNSVKACEYEKADEDFNAGYIWRQILGEETPLTMSSVPATA